MSATTTIRFLLIYLWSKNIAQNNGLKTLCDARSQSDIEAFWAMKSAVCDLPPVERAAEEGQSHEAEMAAKNIRLLTPADRPNAYPLCLLPLFPIPSVIAARGDLRLLRAPQVAIVGSRETMPEAYDICHAIADEIIARGYAVTSGGAFGIDALAHRRAMARAAPTIVVSPGDILSPGSPKNADIYDYAGSRGAIVSQFPCGFVPIKRNFPSRNRIIAALSSATIIIHCREKSGALYTAQAARKLAKPVFVASMRGFHPLSEGGLQLVKQGKAKLISSISDLEELPKTPQQRLLPFPAAMPSAFSAFSELNCNDHAENAISGHSFEYSATAASNGGTSCLNASNGEEHSSRKNCCDEKPSAGILIGKYCGDTVSGGESCGGSLPLGKACAAKKTCGSQRAADEENAQRTENANESAHKSGTADNRAAPLLLSTPQLSAYARTLTESLPTSDAVRHILLQCPMTREMLRQILQFPGDFDEVMLELELRDDIAQRGGIYCLV